jgi:hypothetical protein
MWVLATRSRVNNCDRFIKAWKETHSTTPVYVRLDECDPDLESIKSLPWPSEFNLVVGPRARISQAMQEMFANYPNEPWYGILADDAIPGTRHWDQRLVDAAGLTSISYADEVWEKKARVCHPCVGGDLVRFVGFFGLPVVKHWGTDTVWERIHHECGLNNKQHDVVLEHAHFTFNQASLDRTYEESQALKSQDRAAYRQWMEENFESLKARLCKHFGWQQ